MTSTGLKRELFRLFKSNCDVLLERYTRDHLGYLLWHGEEKIGAALIRQKLTGEKGVTKSEVVLSALLRHYHESIGSLNHFHFTDKGLLAGPDFEAPSSDDYSRAGIYKAQVDYLTRYYEKREIGYVALLNETTEQAKNRVYEKWAGRRGVIKTDASLMMFLVYFHNKIAPLSVIEVRDEVNFNHPDVKYFADNDGVIWFTTPSKQSNHPALLSVQNGMASIALKTQADDDAIANFKLVSDIAAVPGIKDKDLAYFIGENAAIYSISPNGQSNHPSTTSTDKHSVVIRNATGNEVRLPIYTTVRRLRNAYRDQHAVARNLIDARAARTSKTS